MSRNRTQKERKGVSKIMDFWRNKRVVVTGGAGFLGSYLVERLQKRGAADVLVPRSSHCDLTSEVQTADYLQKHRPHVVIHAAATVGGIGANRREPGRFFYQNAMMGLNVVEQSRLAGVEKFVCLGTICAYPKHTPVPFREEELWSGYPEETNAPYGIAKKALLVMLESYRQQYGMNGIYLLPVNLYGPRDNFDPESSHVIPALIRRFEEARLARQSQVTVWGTGKATREFLFAEDAAEGILLAAEHYNSSEPANLGAGFEISIRDLAERIARKVGYAGRIVWDTSKPDGQPRRMLDTSRAERFGFKGWTSFDQGLEQTIHWFRQNRTVIDRQEITVSA